MEMWLYKTTQIYTISDYRHDIWSYTLIHIHTKYDSLICFYIAVWDTHIYK